jgi:ion channel-forming bestrophin family protein
MISYDPKEWFMFIFRFHKADTFRKLFPIIVFVGLYTAGVAYIELEYLDLDMDKDSAVRHISVLHTLLGFALSMLLVFRTNTAYDRWWEGRRVWGSMGNMSRSMATKLDGMLPQSDSENRLFFAAVIPNIAFALKNSLRDKFHRKEWESVADMTDEVAANTKNLPVMTVNLLFLRLQKLRNEGVLNDTQLLLLNTELLTFTETIGACERIKNTPIPFSYSVFLKKFIFLYVMTLPFGYAFTLSWYVIVIVMLIFYALASLELIAEEIENPFGLDANDLPTDQLAAGIRNVVKQILID